MGTDRSAGIYRGLGLPLPLGSTETWSDRIVPSGGAADASYTGQGPVPGPAIASTDNLGGFAPLTAGELDEGAATCTLMLARSGLPGRSEQAQGLIWLRAGEAPRGWDELSAISAFEPIVVVDGSGDPIAVRNVDALALADGTQIIVGRVDQADGDRAVKVWVKKRTDTTWAGTALFTSSSDATGLHPCVWTGPSGAVYVAHWVSPLDADGSLVSIRIHRAPGTDLTAWSVIERRALTDRIPDDARCDRLRAVVHEGRLCLVTCEHEDGAANSELWQYTCPGEAGQLTPVGDGSVAAAGRYHAVLSAEGRLRLLYLTRSETDADDVDVDRKPVQRVVGHATDSLAESDEAALYDWETEGFTNLFFGELNDLGTRDRFSDGDLAAVVDSRGVFYAYMRETASSTTPGRCWALRSEDGGESWTGPTSWYNQGDADTHPRGFAALAALGRAGLVGGHSASPGDEDNSLNVVWLGGWTSSPRLADLNFQRYQAAWDVTWLPYDLPGDCGWTQAAAGASSAALADGALNTSTSTGSRTFTRTITATATTLDTGLSWEVHLDAVTGALGSNRTGLDIVLDDGTDRVHLQVRFDATGARLYDAVTTLTIADITFGLSAPTALIGAIRRAADDTIRVAVWARDTPTNADRHWSLTEGAAAQGTLTTTAAAGNGYFAWGHPTSSTGAATWSLVQYKLEASLVWATGALTGGDEYQQVHPAPLSAGPVALPNGALVSAEQGHGQTLDQATVALDHEIDVRHAWVHEHPSPQIVWRSADDAVEQIIPIDLSPGAGGDVRLPRDTVVIHGERLNFRTWYLEGVLADGTVEELAEIDQAEGASALYYLRHGDAIEPDDTAAGSQAPFVHRRTYEGGTASLSGGAALARIRHVTSGRWVTSSTDEAARPVLTLDGLGGTEPDDGACSLWAPASTTIVHLAGARYRYLRLRIPAQDTVDGYHQGKFFLGFVEVFGVPYDWGRAQEYQDGTVLDRLEDGQDTIYAAAPARRIVELSWPEGVLAVGVGEDPDPDYAFGTTTTGALPIATRGATAHDLHGLMADLKGAARVALYLPVVPAGPPDAITLVDFRRRGVLVRLTTPPRLETITGEEEDLELTRASIGFTEVV